MSINAGTIYSSLELDMNRYEQGLRQAEQQMNTFATNLGNIGKNMEKAGKAWTTKVTLPIVGLGAAAIKTGMDFESGMSEVQAISGSTGEDLKTLEDRARSLAKETKFSATQAADALKYMSLAGWDTKQMYEGLPAVLDLAAAANMDLARASDIVTDTMSAFQMKAEESSKAADIFAKTQAKSNTNVEQLGEAMKYAGAAANSANMDLAETNTVLGILADSGIKGSMAGTTFTAMLRDMKKNADDGKLSVGNMSIALYDAEGSMRDMSDIMYDFEIATKDMTTAQRDAALGAVFGEQALKGMNIVLATGSERYAELEDAIRNSDGAAKDMADTMMDNLKGSWESIKSTLGEVALQIYEILLPSLEKLADKLAAATDWFVNLDQGTRETIIQMAGLAAAIGPILLIGGKLASGISAITGLFGAFTGATATAAGAGGLGALGAGFGATLTAITPWTLGIAGAGVVAYGLYKELNERTIPEVYLFGDEVSKSTKQAVEGFLDLEKDATRSLNQLAWSGAEITDEMKAELVGNFTAMKEGIVGKLQEQKESALMELKEMFANSTTISEEEKKEMLRIAGQKYDEQIKKAEDGNLRILKILEEAKEDGLGITEERRKEMEEIQEEMKEDAIRLLSETQEESETILKNLKDNAGILTAEMASEVVKNSKEQKEQTIANAEEEYSKRLKYAHNLKADGSKESEELARVIIAEATRQKEEAIKAAEEMHTSVVKEAQAQAQEHVTEINWETGELMSAWSKTVEWFKNNPIVQTIVKNVKEFFSSEGSSAEKNDRVNPIGKNAHGTNYWRGGLTWVGEQGPELVDLPQASKVYSNQKSMEMIKGASGGITQHITINSPTPLNPSEVARKNLQISRQLAMEWGV